MGTGGRRARHSDGDGRPPLHLRSGCYAGSGPARPRSDGGPARPWSETGFVLTTEPGGPCDPRNALRALTVAATRAGLPKAGLHTLRHSAASVMLTSCVPLEVVSEILGHSSIATTGDVHGHVAPHVSRDATDVLGAAFGE